LFVGFGVVVDLGFDLIDGPEMSSPNSVSLASSSDASEDATLSMSERSMSS
jgi:hypothetical protein